MNIAFFIWQPDPVLISLGNLEIRWYGLLFTAGFVISRFIVFYMYRKENRVKNNLDYLLIYMIIGTLIGARLGHVLFYEPDYYLQRPIEILKFWEGGLSSHGCGLGIFVAVWFYVNKIGFSRAGVEITRANRQGHGWLQVLDRMVIVVAFGGLCIRVGNFINGENVGQPTGTGYGVVFAGAETQSAQYRVPSVDRIRASTRDGTTTDINLSIYFHSRISDPKKVIDLFEKNVSRLLIRNRTIPHLLVDRPLEYSVSKSDGQYLVQTRGQAIPRHPTQLYEAGICLLTFLLLFWIWSGRKSQTPEGVLVGIFMVVIFGLRFFEEFLKENQVTFEDRMSLNMGQLLSLPFVLFGIGLLSWHLLRSKTSN